MAATPKPQIVMLEGSRSSTPPTAEKVGSWILRWHNDPPERPPSAHNSEFAGPALDPNLYVPPSMESHHIVGEIPVNFIARVPSPSRSNATALLNEELNEHSSAAPDYGEIHKQSTPIRQPQHIHDTASPQQNGTSKTDRHLSNESWGNLGAPRESTFGPMIIPTGQFGRMHGETPALAAAIPLPAYSQYTASAREPSIAAFPSVVPITVEAPSQPAFSRHGSHVDERVSNASPAHDAQEHSQDRVSRGASHRAPSVVSPKSSHHHGLADPTSPRSRITATPQTRHQYLAGLSSPTGVPLPVSEMGSVFNKSPSIAPSRHLASDVGSRAASRKPKTAVSEFSSVSHHQPAASNRSRRPSDRDDANSMATEHNPASVRPPLSTYRGGDTEKSATPRKNDVALHPLTNHTYGGPQAPSSYARSAAGDESHHSHVIPTYDYGQGLDLPHSHIKGASSVHSRPQSPIYTEHEKAVLDEVLLRTPRTSYTMAPSALAAEVHESPFHDDELCLLLHAADNPHAHEVVKKVVRKAINARLRKLARKHEHAHTATKAPVHVKEETPKASLSKQLEEEPPMWARELKHALQETVHTVQDSMHRTNARIDQIDEHLNATVQVALQNSPQNNHRKGDTNHSAYNSPPSPSTVTAKSKNAKSLISPSPSAQHSRNGASARSRSHRQTEERSSITDSDSEEEHHYGHSVHTPPHQDSEVLSALGDGRHAHHSHRDSPGQQYLEQEMYKLKKRDAQSEHSHNTWEIARDEGGHDQPTTVGTETDALPEIPDTDAGEELEQHRSSPPLPALPVAPADPAQLWDEWRPDSETSPPWQRVHQRLLNWAIVWPMSEFDQALNSTLRDHQVNEVALSIWSTQTYKRYVRTRLMDHPRQTVDRLFVPPNMADAINTAVFNGRHGDACGMLRDLWQPFGLGGMPRLLIVLARHRKDQNHWVVHRFSLPDGGLTTYDSYPERSLPDGRPLGWWFAIRIAWPHAMYPSPDHLVQKIVRLHRPLQLLVDNSIAAAGVWRNILMGSRAERTLDLERLRDLINTEVKNLRQRKELGKLTVATVKLNWEDIPGV